jgi:Raf kinase inhibitor-like YbhB/YbcL family protein
MSMTLDSSAFTNGSEIPKKYTCSGEDVAPPLRWGEPPANTRSFALIADDPDAPAGTWVHWVLYNLPGSARGLDEGTPASESLSGGAQQGINDFRKTGYGGPCPPPGKPHRYYFRLYALDTVLNLKPKATKKDVEGAMKGHILGQAELMGRFRR